MFADTFISSLKTNEYNNLLNDEIINDIKEIEESRNTPTAVVIENNFTKNTYKIIFMTLFDNGHFDISGLGSELFQEKTRMVLDMYENKVQIEKGYGFDTIHLENSYDETSIVRDEIKKCFDTWNPYYKRFLNSCLNCFDGESDKNLNGIYFSTKKLYNRIICHEYPDAQYNRDKNIIEQLCNLYGITETNQDLFDLNEIIHKLKPILSKENLKLNYRLSFLKNDFKEFEIMIYPMVHEAREDIFYFTIDSLVENSLLNLTVAEELKQWEGDQRKLGYITLKFVKEDRVRLEILGSYGIT